MRKISPPIGIRSSDRPARRQSLYQLSYPAHTRPITTIPKSSTIRNSNYLIFSNFYQSVFSPASKSGTTNSTAACLYVGCPTRYRTRHFFNKFTGPLLRVATISRTTDTHYRHTLQTHTTDTHYRHTLLTHTTNTHYRHALQTHTTDTHYRHALQTRTTDTHYRHTLQTHSFSLLTQRTYSCSNFVAISLLVLELLKKCRVRYRMGHPVFLQLPFV